MFRMNEFSDFCLSRVRLREGLVRAVLLGALGYGRVIHPAGSVDRTALRWHVGVWDLWFLVWGILLALATVGYWRRTGEQNP